MGFTVRADYSFRRLFIFQNWVFKGICIVWSSQYIGFKVKSIDDMMPEGWIPTLILELMVRHEQLLWTHSARVHSYVFGPPVLSSKRSLMPHSLSNIVLKRCQLLFKGCISLIKYVCSPVLKLLNWIPFSKWFRFFNDFLIFHNYCFLNFENIVDHPSILYDSYIINLVKPRLNLWILLWSFAKEFHDFGFVIYFWSFDRFFCTLSLFFSQFL